MRQIYKFLVLSSLFSLLFTWSLADDTFNKNSKITSRNMSYQAEQDIPEPSAYGNFVSGSNFSAEPLKDINKNVIDEMAFLNGDIIETEYIANLFDNSDSFSYLEEDESGIEPGGVATLGVGILGLVAIIRRRVGESNYGSQVIQKFGDPSNTKKSGVCLGKESMPLNKTLKTQASDCSCH